MSMSEEEQYRRDKEASVTGLKGTDPLDVQLVATIGITSHFLLKALTKNPAYHSSPTWIQFLIDHVVLILPMLGSFAFPSLVGWILALQVALGIALVYASGRGRKLRLWAPSALGKEDRESLVSLIENRKPFMTAYRAMMMITTCVCILAVDFPIFPRKHAKTEDFGTSLMDAGVGAFVLANSLTAEFSLRKSSLYGSLKACIPVLILAFIRLVTVKSVEYQEHASEYGVHWNFFFTLGCMPVLGLLGKELVGVSNLWVLGVAMAVGYQVVLSGTDLQEYILTAKRVDLLSMNREGIFSLVGYAAIYYLGISLGAQLMKRKNLPDWYRTVVNFMALDVLLWILLFVLEHFGIEVSRRMANLPYVIWVFAYNIPVIAGFLFCDLAVGYSKMGLLYEAINKNQLAIFLLANLMTGVVNLSMRTIYATTFESLLVLLLYCGAFTGVAVFLHLHNLVVKFW